MSTQQLVEALARFKEHFKQPVAGRSLKELSGSEITRLVECSIAAGEVDPQLKGPMTDIVAAAHIATPSETEAEGIRAEALRRAQVLRVSQTPRNAPPDSST